MTTTTATIEAPTTTTIRTPGWAGAFAGLIGAAVALGVSELIAGVLSPGSSLIAAVGQTIIDLQPPGAKDFVVALFGTNDKLALEVLVAGTRSRSGHCSAISARDRFAIAAGGFVAFGILGFLAVLRLPLGSATIGALSAGIAVIAGLQVMSWLMRRHAAAGPRTHEQACPIGAVGNCSSPVRRSGSRRSPEGSWAGCSGLVRASRRPEADAQIPPASAVAAALAAGHRPVAAGRRPHPDRHAERPVLPDRHRAPHPIVDTRHAGRCASTAWSTARRR